MAPRNPIVFPWGNRTATSDPSGISVDESEPTVEIIITGDELAIGIYKDGVWLGEVIFTRISWEHVVPEPGEQEDIADADKLRSFLDKKFDGKVFTLTNYNVLMDELFNLGYTRRE